MNFTQAQITEILLDVANKKEGFNSIMKMSLDALMRSERKIFQEDHHEYSNGYRPRCVQGFGKEIVLSVPRTRSGGFYPLLLGIIRDEDQERQKLVFSLYSKGLTTEQIGQVYHDVYGKHYSKSQISFLMNDAREEASIWLERKLDSHYLVIYIDATFVSTRRDKSVSKEAYFSILGVKEDGTREVLSIVNHPAEGAGLWENEFENLKARGVQSIGLVVSDGLTAIENAVAKSFTGTAHQLCVVHFKRNITKVFPMKIKKEINEELKKVFLIGSNNDNPIDGFNRLQEFIDKWEPKYPTLKSYRNQRNIYYFTYTQFPDSIQRMIYSTNWIERLNRNYKRVLKMRGAMPSANSVLFLMGSTAMEMGENCYSYTVSSFRDIIQLKRK
jgi:transposase-like protein